MTDHHKGQVTYDTVRDLARRLPEVEESTSYGTPALKVRGKLFVRLKEDGESIVLRSDPFERAHLLETAPQLFSSLITIATRPGFSYVSPRPIRHSCES